jgi:hypothetical protein
MNPRGRRDRMVVGFTTTYAIIFIDDLPMMRPTKFRFIWQSGFRGEFFLEINQSETRIVCGGQHLWEVLY